MKDLTKINGNIYRLTIPYKTIFTTVYAIKTESGALLFDCATYEKDVTDYIIPFLSELGIDNEMLKYVFISHNHRDHAGGLSYLLKAFPTVTVLSRSWELRESLPEYKFQTPEDEDTILECLCPVVIPGHTKDSCALLDKRTKSLITGDCMQFFGIVGNEDWGANIFLPAEHLNALNKLKGLEIEEIYTAHDYYPYGYKHIGKTEVDRGIKTCADAVLRARDIVKNNPTLTDEELKDIYDDGPDKPTVNKYVMTCMREYIEKGKI